MNSIFRNSEVSLTRDLHANLAELSAGYSAGKIFLLFDENTWKHCWPLVEGFRQIPHENLLVLASGEEQKNIEQVMRVWDYFGGRGIDRSSLIINVGGGMLTDLGGFAAGTLKRGLPFINIPTTLLAMVDASVGGKSGINFRGLKNEVGTIRQPLHVLLYLPFLKTLDKENLLSGYAEMLKAGLIADASLWNDLMEFDLSRYDEEAMGRLIWRSIEIKKEIVDSDPEEKGLRKSLNFGHTIGHAFESESLHAGNPVPHGYAVAWGMIAEAALSVEKLGLAVESLRVMRDEIHRLYGRPPEGFREAGQLIPWMKFDKKNTDHRINFTLLEQIGKCRINCTATEEEIIRCCRDA
ncbi:MAG: 3-dehydroquinate synthase [Bacteroidetes bacterium GWF2_49_14]|nr:MAG: 3-dehydroquinate synthase [Bacteroidetes bacterium GWF2_49_14]